MSGDAQQISRRGFLGGLIVVGFALAPSALVRLLRPTSNDEASTAAERLLLLFRDPTELWPLGRAYLDSRVDRPSERALLAELLPPDMSQNDVIFASDAELRDAIRRSTSNDLTSGRVEDFDGWLLGRSEVRLAALVTMMSLPGGRI